MPIKCTHTCLLAVLPSRHRHGGQSLACCWPVARGGDSSDPQPHPQARNDLYAGEIKFVKDELSVMARLELVVPDGQGEDLLKAADGDAWECGPFVVRHGRRFDSPATLRCCDAGPVLQSVRCASQCVFGAGLGSWFPRSSPQHVCISRVDGAPRSCML